MSTTHIFGQGTRQAHNPALTSTYFTCVAMRGAVRYRIPEILMMTETTGRADRKTSFCRRWEGFGP